MGVEPPPGAGPSACSRAGAHHRVCSCSLAGAQRGYQLAFPFTRVWVGRSGPALESGPLLGARLCSPARWHATLSRRAVAGCARAAHRSRREPAGGLCGQHPQLSLLSPARTVSMTWEGCHQAPSSERAAAPAPHRFCAPALEGLEPEAASTRVHAAPARPTPRSAGRTDALGQPGCLTCAPFPCAASSLPTLVAREIGRASCRERV